MSTVHQAGRNNYSDSVSDATSTGEAANIHTKLKSISCELSNMRSWLSQGGEAETVKPSPSTPSIHTSHLPSCSGGQYKVHLPPTYFQSNFTRTQLLSHLSLAPCAGSCREMEVVKLTSDLFKYAPSHFFMTHHTSQPQFCDNLSTQCDWGRKTVRSDAAVYSRLSSKGGNFRINQGNSHPKLLPSVKTGIFQAQLHNKI